SDWIRKRSTCTAAPARWVIRLAPRAPVFWSLCWVRCGPGSSAVASRPSASAGAKQPPWPSNCSTEEANMLLTDEQREIADMARQFAQQRLLPFAAEWDREHQFPADALAEMGELGFLGMLVPEQWGGCDTGYLTYALALEEIAAGDGACSTIMSVHNSVGCAPILRFGSEEQKQRFLPPLASGRQIGAFALTEPHAGSDAGSLRTRARRDGDSYVLDGAKQFITSGREAGTVIVFVVTDPDAGKKGISAFIVPTDSPGYQVVRVEDKLGQHAS